jgi:hypothetical protein
MLMKVPLGRLSGDRPPKSGLRPPVIGGGWSVDVIARSTSSIARVSPEESFETAQSDT